jgi:excisionase family DNA binding protein
MNKGHASDQTSLFELSAHRGVSSAFLVVEDVAARLRCSIRTIHELTRRGAIPHRRLPGSRRCLFRADELEAWENGARLEVTALPRGGRIVRPMQPRDLAVETDAGDRA